MDARAELWLWGMSKALGVGKTTLLGEEQEGILGKQLWGHRVP